MATLWQHQIVTSTKTVINTDGTWYKFATDSVATAMFHDRNGYIYRALNDSGLDEETGKQVSTIEKYDLSGKLLGETKFLGGYNAYMVEHDDNIIAVGSNTDGYGHLSIISKDELKTIKEYSYLPISDGFMVCSEVIEDKYVYCSEDIPEKIVDGIGEDYRDWISKYEIRTGEKTKLHMFADGKNRDANRIRSILDFRDKFVVLTSERLYLGKEKEWESVLNFSDTGYEGHYILRYSDNIIDVYLANYNGVYDEKCKYGKGYADFGEVWRIDLTDFSIIRKVPIKAVSADAGGDVVIIPKEFFEGQEIKIYGHG